MVDGEWVSARRIAGRHTELQELVDRRSGRRRYIKRIRDGHGGLGRLRREFRALTVLHAHGLPFVDTVPTPVCLLADPALLVTESLAGVSLSSILKRDANILTGLACRQRLARYGDRVGAWLAAFQRSTRRPDLAHDHDTFCSRLVGELGRVAAIEGNGLEAVRRQLAALSARVAGQPVERTARHGDFLPQNVLLGKSGIGILDFEGFRRCDVAHRDIGYMLAYLRFLAYRGPYLAGALRVFSEAFAAACGASPASVRQRLFTAEAAVRLALDSGRRETVRTMGRIVADLCDAADERLPSVSAVAGRPLRAAQPPAGSP
jgi:aminoglycoside phosphotransferase (APT) family kinase protein